jgi:hypothetical protein
MAAGQKGCCEHKGRLWVGLLVDDIVIFSWGLSLFLFDFSLLLAFFSVLCPH